MDKFTLKRKDSTRTEAYKTLNIRGSDYDRLCQVSQETGHRISELASLAIRFAFERLEIVDED